MCENITGRDLSLISFSSSTNIAPIFLNFQRHAYCGQFHALRKQENHTFQYFFNNFNCLSTPAQNPRGATK